MGGEEVRTTKDVLAAGRSGVLRIITRLNIGGPSRHVLTLTSGLPAFGHHSELIAGIVGPREGNVRPPDPTKVTIVPTLRREINPLVDFRAWRALTRIVRSRRPLIVHTHHAKAGTLGRLAAKRAGVPFIIHTFHGHVLEGYFPRPITHAFLEVERMLARRTDVLIAISTIIRDELLALGIGSPEQWRVVPLGLELDHLVDHLPARGEARKSLGLPPDVLLVGLVGRLAPIKDVPAFLEASKLVGDTDRDVQFVVAGDGPLKDRLEAQGRATFGDRIHFLGWVMDLPALYAALDIVVLTSKNEGTPVSLIEASAAALPVVGTNVGGVSDVIDDGVTGFLVPPADTQDMARRVKTLLENAELRLEMGLAGRAHVMRRFSAEQLVQEIANLYDELITSRQCPSEE